MLSIDERISQIAEDHESGASVLAKKTLDCWEAFATTPPTLSYWEDLLTLSKKLSGAQPDMAPLFSICHEIVSAAKTLHEKRISSDECSRLILQLVKKIRVHLHEASKKITALAFGLLPNQAVILTHSYSSTVKNTLCAIHKMGKTPQVIVTESRPMYEGRQLAQDLGREGIHTTLIVDAAVNSVMSEVNYVIIGADRVSQEVFVNKIGTLSLLLSAKYHTRPAYLICDTLKFIPQESFPIDKKPHPKEEVLSERYPNVSVENPYFEEIPLILLKGILCNKGLFSPQEIRIRLNEV